MSVLGYLKENQYLWQGVSLVLGTEDHQEQLLEVSKNSLSDFYLLPQIPAFQQDESQKTNGTSYEQMLDEVTRLAGIQSKSG